MNRRNVLKIAKKYGLSEGTALICEQVAKEMKDAFEKNNFHIVFHAYNFPNIEIRKPHEKKKRS